jgi:hypothetical protein
MSDLSDNLKLTLLNTGEAVGDWGNITNNNLKEIEQAITSSYTLDMKPAAGGAWGESKILTIDSSIGASARNMAILVTSSSTTYPTTTATYDITVPNIKKLYLFKLSTTATSPAVISWVEAAYYNNVNVFVKTATGANTIMLTYQAGVTGGDTPEYYSFPTFVAVYCDGTDVYPLTNAGPTSVQGLGVRGSAGVFGVLPKDHGGTGRDTYSYYNQLILTGSSAFDTVNRPTTTNQVLRSDTTTGSPQWGKVVLSTDVSGALPVAYGGTGIITAPTAGGAVYGNGTTLAFTAAGTSGQVLTSAGAGAPYWSSVSAGSGVTSVSGTTGRITVTGTTAPVVDLASGVVTAGTTGSSALIPVITVDTYGRVTSVTTAAAAQGTVTSVSGTTGRITVTGTTAPVVDLAVSGVGTGTTVGSATAIPVITYDTYGRITAISTATPSIGGTVGVANGGTGATTFTAGLLVSTGGTAAISTTAAPTGTVVGTTDTQTLTNKRITPRVISTASQGSTFSFNSDSYDGASLNGVSGGVTSITFTVDAGAPTDQQKYTFKLYLPANITLSWTSGTKGFRAAGVTLPTTSGTTANKALYVGCVYNSTESFWDVIAVTQVA